MENPMTPPPGGDVNRGPSMLGVAWGTTLFAFVFFCFRMYARIRIIHRFDAADYALVCAMVLAFAGVALNIPEVRAGFGRHIFYLTPEQGVTANKYSYLAIPFLVFSVWFSKISICATLMHINTKTWAKWTLWSMMVFVFLANCVCVIIIFAQCQPVDGLWDRSKKANCISPAWQEWSAISQGIVSVVSDFFLSTFPIYILWNLKLKLRSKVVIGCLMGLGIFAGVSGIVRTVKATSIALREDFTFAGVDLAIWSLIEQNTALIAASVPALRSFFLQSFRETNAYTKGGRTAPSHLYGYNSNSKSRGHHLSKLRSLDTTSRQYGNGSSTDEATLVDKTEPWSGRSFGKRTPALGPVTSVEAGNGRYRTESDSAISEEKTSNEENNVFLLPIHQNHITRQTDIDIRYDDRANSRV